MRVRVWVVRLRVWAVGVRVGCEGESGYESENGSEGVKVRVWVGG